MILENNDKNKDSGNSVQVCHSSTFMDLGHDVISIPVFI